MIQYDFRYFVFGETSIPRPVVSVPLSYMCRRTCSVYMLHVCMQLAIIIIIVVGAHRCVWVCVSAFTQIGRRRVHIHPAAGNMVFICIVMLERTSHYFIFCSSARQRAFVTATAVVSMYNETKYLHILYIVCLFCKHSALLILTKAKNPFQKNLPNN